ncbi:MAG: glycosyltransferase family 2 protein [Chloroflexi bacterium]|nr:glycosyltransferase family 2 protein [Chloroflexota bacterium]
MSAGKAIKYSIVVPIYNSSAIVDQTIERIVTFFEKHSWDYELILINDGSRDQSWDVLREKALDNPHLIAVNLLKNYGQHTAVFCGFQKSSGDYVITLDDDLQNPPEECIHLINKIEEGHDLIFGRFRQKQHASYRRLGSKLVGWINRKIFHKPDDLVLSNFRIIRRDVIERVSAYQTNYPYIPGLLLMFAVNPANVWVEHHARPVGQSNYNLIKIMRLVMRLLFNYSSYPLRVVSISGMIIAAISFILGIIYLMRALLIGTSVPGWATLVILSSFLNGLTLLILGMLGEYVVRLLNQVSSSAVYHIKEIIESNA